VWEREGKLKKDQYTQNSGAPGLGSGEGVFTTIGLNSPPVGTWSSPRLWGEDSLTGVGTYRGAK
jgi:hypothetical protein